MAGIYSGARHGIDCSHSVGTGGRSKVVVVVVALGCARGVNNHTDFFFCFAKVVEQILTTLSCPVYMTVDAIVCCVANVVVVVGGTQCRGAQ